MLTVLLSLTLTTVPQTNACTVWWRGSMETITIEGPNSLHECRAIAADDPSNILIQPLPPVFAAQGMRQHAVCRGMSGKDLVVVRAGGWDMGKLTVACQHIKRISASLID
jgi:hypothetical protein